MPKVKIISPNCWQYQCECGQTITLEWDERDPPPKKLIKCFQCIKREAEEREKK